ncbi:Uncharacterized protein TCM_033744 [Theobroma cacao]|uniref:Uncharacterized protein n=1 Tax=Theobroma cacao TaxID=3641 RepID=A0A061FBD8_THECC|nr:Uncharacterized protein TCM_033744 [Theobroma cacao]
MPKLLSKELTSYEIYDQLKINLFVRNWLIFSLGTPRPQQVLWPVRNISSNSDHFEISCGSRPKQPASAHPTFGVDVVNSSFTLLNLISNPTKRSRNLNQLFM